MNTNASDTNIAKVLAELGDSGQGNIASFVVRKKGVERGPAGDKKIYDNELVHVLVWTGFQYKALVERSSRKLEEMIAKSPHFLQELAQATIDAGATDATIQDAAEALQEIQAHFHHVLEGRSAGPDDAFDDLPESVWEPLKADGVAVKGVKVYRGPARTDDPRAPKPGSVYLDGVKLGEKVIEEALPWTTKQKPKTVAKTLIRTGLPVGLYVRYALGPDALPTLKVGKDASEAAKVAGVAVDPDRIRLLFKIA